MTNSDRYGARWAAAVIEAKAQKALLDALAKEGQLELAGEDSAALGKFCDCGAPIFTGRWCGQCATEKFTQDQD